jgi:hypothetical protein
VFPTFLLDSVVKLALVDNVESGRMARDAIRRYNLDFGWQSVLETMVMTKTGRQGQELCADDGNLCLSRNDNNASTMKTRLLILDGDYIANGTFSIVDLPHHGNYSLHSLFEDWFMLD